MGDGDIVLDSLRAWPALVPTLAGWFHEAWFDIEALPRESLARELHERLGGSGVPVTWVALERSRPIGTVSIDPHDLPGQEHLTPWLASLYVVPDRRGAGLGRRLVRHAQHWAREAGIGALYLWTAGGTALYDAAGFRTCDTVAHRGHRLTVMRWSVSGSEQSPRGGCAVRQA